MAPTVYIADISCDASDSSDSDQPHTPPTFILDFGDNDDLRVRRRNHVMDRRNSFRLRRPLSCRAVRPSRADSARTPLCAAEAPAPPCKSDHAALPRCHRLLLLRRHKEGLLDITVRTVALIRRNQQLQARLAVLQAETRAFVQSVLSNPENATTDEGVKSNDISTAMDSDGTGDV